MKPYFVRRAAELLNDTGVIVGAVIGFPHGNSATEVKRYETEIACRDGAREIDMVINVGKAMGGAWDYVERDIEAVCAQAHGQGAKVKVILENDYLGNGGGGLNSADLKRKLCQIAERAGADWVKTSTGYGFVKGPDGKYSYEGATEEDLKLMRAAVSDHVQVKAAGGVRDLDALVVVQGVGVFPMRRLCHGGDVGRVRQARRGRSQWRPGRGPCLPIGEWRVLIAAKRSD